MLVSKGKATLGVREAVMAAEKGLVWVQLAEVGDAEGGFGQILWNKAVREIVGAGLGVGFVYKPGEAGLVRELRLCLEGRVWEGGGDEAEKVKS